MRACLSIVNRDTPKPSFIYTYIHIYIYPLVFSASLVRCMGHKCLVVWLGEPVVYRCVVLPLPSAYEPRYLDTYLLIYGAAVTGNVFQWQIPFCCQDRV